MREQDERLQTTGFAGVGGKPRGGGALFGVVVRLSDSLVLSCKVASPATDGGTKEKTRHGRRVSTGAD